MFPIPFNFPFRKKDGSITTMDDAISSGGGGGYTLPTATANRLGGVKIGNGVNVQEDGTISVSGGASSVIPNYTTGMLECGTSGDYKYYIEMQRQYIGTGIAGYEIKTNPESSQTVAKIDIYSIIYSAGEVKSSTLIKTLSHNGDKTYVDENISVDYNSGTASWVVTLLTSIYKDDGTLWVSPISWAYDQVVDHVLLEENPV